MREFLYPELVKITNAKSSTDPLPLLYLNDDQAQFLNEYGLYMVAESLHKNKKKPEDSEK